MARQKRELHFITKVINNISFTSHKYEKGKYLITAEGYEGERWVGYNTWEKRNDGDMTDGRSSFSPKNKRWFQVSFIEKVKEMIGKIKKVIIPKLTELYPMPLLLNAPKTEYEVLLDFAKKYALPKKLARLNEVIENEKQDKSDVVDFLISIIKSSTEKKYRKEIYRELSKAFHPDLNNNDGLYFKKINEIFNR